jgi:hypothetical protein
VRIVNHEAIDGVSFLGFPYSCRNIQVEDKTMNQLPYQVQAIREQLGKGLRGALVYVGASQLTYSCKYENGGAESKVTDNGSIDAPVSLAFSVNGKRGAGWKIIVSLEPSDTYTVRLWQASRIGPKRAVRLMAECKPIPAGEVLDEASGVYCDQLQGIVEQMYDKAIKEKNDGFIPLG